VLRALDYAFQVQTAVTDSEGRKRFPDYALFATDSERAAAEATAGTTTYFASALAIADAKVWDASLDRAPRAQSGGFDRRNPNYQIDAYLRETDRRWGILTNGRRWRLYLRDTSYRLNSYYEIDLIELLDADVEHFNYFWAFFHRRALEGQPAAFVDRVKVQSEEFAEALSERVKDRVYEALTEFINGFLQFPGNDLVPMTDLEETYENCLILLYRLLFSLYAEAHELLPLHNPAYRDTYSLARIKRELADRLDAGKPLLPGANNYYADLQNLFTIIDGGANALGVPPYNGGLFDPTTHPFLTTNQLGDEYLARGLDLLARAPQDDRLAFVDYRTLEIRHLGDIYEGLLEYHPRFAEVEMVAVRAQRSQVWKTAAEVEPGDTVLSRVPPGRCFLATGKGERRATGSYYTPQHIVELMIEDSVGRLVADVEARADGDERVDGLLNLRVCDPAMGSGHFLVEAVSYIARAIVRAGGEAASVDDTDLQAARRRVVERCVYGVDPNPLAVELAKLSLWLATVARDRPLSFLDAHLLRGDSLIGTSIARMGSLTSETGTQMNLVEEALGRILPRLLEKMHLLTESASSSIEDIANKERLLEELDQLRADFVRTAHLWTSRHFGVSVTEADYLHAVASLSEMGSDSEDPSAAIDAERAAERFGFHHWELAFPEVFLSSGRPAGFDAVVTNPPYVSAIERRRAYDDSVDRYWRKHYVAASGAFDLYVLFLELVPHLARPGGWACIITPNKFLAAPYARSLREATAARHALVRLIDASRVPVFEDPSVYPVISVFHAHRPGSRDVEVLRLTDAGELNPQASHPVDALSRLPESLWAFLLLADATLLLRIGESHPELETHEGLRAVASTAAAEADAFGPQLREEHLAPSPGWRVVVTGTIERYSGAWGRRRLSHQGRHLLRPVLPYKATVVSNERRTQYWSPKLIFKKIARRLDAVVDHGGSYASMNTNFVLPGSVDIYALGALFHSRLVSWIYEGYFGALRMQGGYLQVQAPQLRVLPMPGLPGHLSEERLDALVQGEDPLDAPLPSPDDVTSSRERLYALLRLYGRTAQRDAEAIHEERRDVVSRLLDILGLRERREQDASFVLPRQEAILAAIEDLDAPDLSAFWTPVRSTARQLGVPITGAREQALTQVAHSARERLDRPSRRINALGLRIDQVVYRLYGLSDAEASRVERGHDPPPGVTVQSDP